MRTNVDVVQRPCRGELLPVLQGSRLPPPDPRGAGAGRRGQWDVVSVRAAPVLRVVERVNRRPPDSFRAHRKRD